MDPITRRALIRHGALGAAAFAAAATPLARTAGAAAAQAGPALAGPRREAYAALVESVDPGDGLQIRPDQATRATDYISASYQQWDSTVRREFDLVLDQLERGAKGGSFTRTTRGSRRDQVHAWCSDTPAGGRRPGPRQTPMASGADPSKPPSRSSAGTDVEAEGQLDNDPYARSQDDFAPLVLSGPALRNYAATRALVFAAVPFYPATDEFGHWSL
jgi:hypothetical protein